MSNPKRVQWPKAVADIVLTQSHHRCCVCLEHRRIGHIHHIDKNPSNSIESNAVGLCTECHTDVHTTSSMRRGITPDQLQAYKRIWIEKCKDLEMVLRSNVSAFGSLYYLNVHRLESLCIEYGRQSIVSQVPHRYPAQEGKYNSLWMNPKNSLDWVSLAENRSYYEEVLNDVLPEIPIVDVNLIELGAVDANDRVGGLVGFSCQFLGQDIPSQEELVESCGIISGPVPTMRREVTHASDELVIETCLVLDATYMYSDSAFNQFSAHGIWSGFGRIIKVRDVGSDDGNLQRRQVVVSPVCIGTPADRSHTTRIPAERASADPQYSELHQMLADAEDQR